MVGDSFVARTHGIQYCDADSRGEAECSCYKCENKRLTALLSSTERERDEARDAIKVNAELIRDQEQSYLSALSELSEARASVGVLVSHVRKLIDRLSIDPADCAYNVTADGEAIDEAETALRDLPASATSVLDDVRRKALEDLIDRWQAIANDASAGDDTSETNIGYAAGLRVAAEELRALAKLPGKTT